MAPFFISTQFIMKPRQRQHSTNKSVPSFKTQRPYMIVMESHGQIMAFESKAQYKEFLASRDTELCRY